MFRGHTRGVYPLIFIPADEDNDVDDYENNQDFLVTGSADWTAKLWAFETARCIRTFKGDSSFSIRKICYCLSCMLKRSVAYHVIYFTTAYCERVIVYTIIYILHNVIILQLTFRTPPKH